MADTSEAVPEGLNGDGTDASAIKQNSDFVTYWLAQLKAYDDEFSDWTKRAKKIIRRYRDERQEKSDGSTLAGSRFNVLWSNVQTLLPAIYINPPKPVVERRYLDKDPIARISSMTLERAIEVQIDVGKLHPSMRMAVLDYLLVGRGTVWERYEPTYGEPQDISEQTEAELSTDAKDDAGAAPRPVTYEKVYTDYVSWDRFKHSPAAIWDDVWWVSKGEMLTRKQLRARFKEKDPITGKPIADLIPLRDGGKDKENDHEKKRRQPRALVAEIWDKTEKEVIFIAPDWPVRPLERTPDPLHLEEFWPCPQPLYATTTNDTLVPVPDYAEYQDQAEELDNLTNRISALTDALRVNGVYDASIPELKRILSEGVDNRMIGVKNWSELTSKGGLAKAMDFVPIKEVADALLTMYEARDKVKADLNEITGLSDIVRGQAQGAAKTATEQRIKGQFASLRLEDRKKAVAAFVRDDIRVKGEIISEQFSPEILAEMTGMVPFIADELKAEAPPLQPAMPGNSPPASPGIGAPGQPTPPGAAGAQPPVDPAMQQQLMEQAQQQREMQIQQAAQQRFSQACALLQDDKMRTFRIDIETDSTVEVDRQAAKEAVVEMFTAVGGFLEKALPIGQLMPQLTPALGQSILFAFRTFGAGRDVEGMWEQAIDQLTQMSKNPPPKQPSPEQIKAEAELQKQSMENERSQQEFAMNQRQAEMDMAMKEREGQMKLQERAMELQFKEREFQLKEREIMLSTAAKAHEANVNSQARERDAAIDERAAYRDASLSDQAAERDAEMGREAHEQGLETLTAQNQAKQKAARQPMNA